METLFLEKDGRCAWLENKVLKSMTPRVVESLANPYSKTLILVADWISNDGGRVGVDRTWLKRSGLPVVDSVRDLPPDRRSFRVFNTGYDSIVDEEQALTREGVEILDRPCPFIRRIRKIFEQRDPRRQYVYLCEPNHITVRNFASIFPDDLILVQMENYQERVRSQSNGKPITLVPYVTFLPSDAAAIAAFINKEFPQAPCEVLKTACLWVDSKASPIREIADIPDEQLRDVSHAALLTTTGSTNKSLVSLEKTLQRRGLRVARIGSLWDYLRFQRRHRGARVLLVRSPIPNEAEAPVMAYAKRGLLMALVVWTLQCTPIRQWAFRLRLALLKTRYRLRARHSIRAARQAGLLKEQYR